MLNANWKSTQLKIGDTLRVHSTVVEGDKNRVQVFEGILIAFSGRDVNRTITVRHIGPGGVGVERIWPLDSRAIVKIGVKKHATKVRRSKLYYLRCLVGQQATRV